MSDSTKARLMTSKNMCSDDDFTDCVIIVESRKFKCHKLILAYASEFFKRMLLGDFKESREDIHLDDVTALTFSIFRDYIYTFDENDLKEHNTKTIIDLFACGDRWLVPSVVNDCLNLLMERAKTMNVEELIDLFEFGHRFNRTALINHVYEMLVLNHSDHLFCDTFILLSFEAFKQYISKATNKTEWKRYNLIIKYLKSHGFLGYVKPMEVKFIDKKITLKFEDTQDNFDKEKESNNTVAESECETKSNLDNEKKENNVDEFKSKNIKQKYAQDLMKLINFSEMSADEFYEGPGKSKFLTFEAKYEILYEIHKKVKCQKHQVRLGFIPAFY